MRACYILDMGKLDSKRQKRGHDSWTCTHNNKAVYTLDEYIIVENRRMSCLKAVS